MKIYLYHILLEIKDEGGAVMVLQSHEEVKDIHQFVIDAVNETGAFCYEITKRNSRIRAMKKTVLVMEEFEPTTRKQKINEAIMKAVNNPNLN